MPTPVRRPAPLAWLVVWLSLFAPSASMARQVDRPEGNPPARVQETPTARRSETFLSWMVRASGPIGLVILGMSFYLVAVVAWMSFHYRRAVALPPALLEEVSSLLGRKQFDQAYTRLAGDDSFLARTLAAGVRRLSSGLPAAQRAMEMANEDATMEMEHRTTYLATVGTLGPMIGLVGTVYGMIMSFKVIASTGASAEANELAAGISTALFATLEGIAVSIPAIASYALFRNRIARLSLEVALASDALLEQFALGVRAPHPLIAPASQGPPRTALPPKDK